MIHKSVAAVLLMMFGAMGAGAVTVTTQISGDGQMALDPSGGTYTAGTPVELTADPDTGWQFDHWEIVQAPTKASSPTPADSATGVSTSQDLSWTAGTDSPPTSHDVYFGTTNPPPFAANQGGTTFDTGTMSNATTYYWRVDETNAAGTTTGDVWSFTTATKSGCGSPPVASGQSGRRTALFSVVPSAICLLALGVWRMLKHRMAAKHLALLLGVGTLALMSGGLALAWTSSTNPETITVDRNTRVTAYFTEIPTDLSWSDGFESGTWAGGGWTSCTASLSSSAAAVNQGSTWGVVFNSSDSITKLLSTSGHTNISLVFYRATQGCEAGDHFISEWYDGTSWHVLEDLEGDAPTWDWDYFELPAGADDNADFRLRFRTSGNGASDYVALDDVFVFSRNDIGRGLATYGSIHDDVWLQDEDIRYLGETITFDGPVVVDLPSGTGRYYGDLGQQPVFTDMLPEDFVWTVDVTSDRPTSSGKLWLEFTFWSGGAVAYTIKGGADYDLGQIRTDSNWTSGGVNVGLPGGAFSMRLRRVSSTLYFEYNTGGGWTALDSAAAGAYASHNQGFSIRTENAGPWVLDEVTLAASGVANLNDAATPTANGTQLGFSLLPDSSAAERSWTQSKMTESGVNILRMQMHWALREPTDDNWYWGPMDDRIDWAVGQGYEVFICVEPNGPGWACGTPSNSQSCVYNDNEEFREFVEQMLLRYGYDIDYIQFGTEVDSEYWYAGTMSQFEIPANILADEVAQYETAYPSADDIKVVLASVTTTGALAVAVCGEGYSFEHPMILTTLMLEPHMIEPLWCGSGQGGDAKLDRIDDLMDNVDHDLIDIHLYDASHNFPIIAQAYDDRYPSHAPLMASEIGGPSPPSDDADYNTYEFYAQEQAAILRAADSLGFDPILFWTLADIPGAYHGNHGLWTSDNPPVEKPAPWAMYKWYADWLTP